ncbi:hypothetical protein HYFRA_00008274 [Hymenoscyphus fraxineus]|uniref:Uncharacterized protein n=1 Tax=Hymenoscyphus fraxineus TaxID=746836 RepID=A0A9N9KQ69_9HELO|nr:hypothetical protein HYFRA_00008274 [Hymenoscyphus fraxineus]
MPHTLRRLTALVVRVLGLRRRRNSSAEDNADELESGSAEVDASTHIKYTITPRSQATNSQGSSQDTPIFDVYVHQNESGDVTTEKDLAILSRLLNDPLGVQNRGLNKGKYIVHRELIH